MRTDDEEHYHLRVLFGAGKIAGGKPSVPGAMALAGWATVPEMFRLGVGIIAIHFALSDVVVTDIQQLLPALEAAMAPYEPVLLVTSMKTIA